MANKYMERCSISFSIKECKLRLQHHYKLIKMAKKSDDTKGAEKFTHIPGGNGEHSKHSAK